MANTNLKAALSHAGLTAEQFAEIVGVDPKTVQRWVSGRTPYPRHRAAIARALDSTEYALWPDSGLPPPPGAPAAASTVSAAGDVIGAWGYDTDRDAPDPTTFIVQSSGPVAIFDDGWWSVLEVPGLREALLGAARAGREIRLLSHRPRRDLRPLIGQDHISIRLSWLESRLTVIRVGDAILLRLRLELEADQPPPLLHLRRHIHGGLFDRLADHLDLLWDDAEETVTNVDDFYANVLERNLDEDEDEDDPDDLEDSEADRATQESRSGPDSTGVLERNDDPVPPQAENDPRRRWPRRAP